MKPLDPRLLRHASAVRPFVFACAALGVLTAMLVLAQAELLAKTITWAADKHVGSDALWPIKCCTNKEWTSDGAPSADFTKA